MGIIHHPAGEFGWLGVALGWVLGVALALHVDTIVPFSTHLRFQIWTPCVLHTAIPRGVTWRNIVTIACWRAADGARPPLSGDPRGTHCAGRSAAHSSPWAPTNG